MLNFNRHAERRVASAPGMMNQFRRRLIALFLALAVTIYASMWAADPRHWDWFTAHLGQAEHTPASTQTGPTPSGNPTESGNTTEKPVHDTQLVMTAPAATSHISSHLESNETPDGPANLVGIPDLDAKPHSVPKSDTSVKVDELGNMTENWEQVDDNSTGLLRTELTIYYQLLIKAEHSQHEKWSATAHYPSFTELIQTPSLYRGTALVLHGNALLIQEINEPSNSSHIEKTYEIWLQTRDSGNDLYRIRAIAGHQKMRLGSQRTPMSVYGYFLKRQSYAGTHGFRTSPMIVTAKVEIQKPIPRPFEQYRSYIMFGSVSLIAALALISVYLSWSDRQFEKKVIQPMLEMTPEEQANLIEMQEHAMTDAEITERDKLDFPHMK
jgi:hypothetical protein